MRNLILTWAILVMQMVFPTYSTKSVEFTSVYPEITHVVEQELVKPYNTDSLLMELNMYTQFNEKAKEQVKQIASNLNIQEEWLYKVIYLESRGLTNKRNPHSGAIGLIQFTPRTAGILGTSSNELAKMSVNDQLVYVEKYLEIAKHDKHIGTFDDLYLSVFSPAAIGRLPGHIIGPKHSKTYTWNKAMDVNKDSVLTVRDVSKFIASKF